MIIISKKKQFYDYLTNIYGRDERIVYHREKMESPVTFSEKDGRIIEFGIAYKQSRLTQNHFDLDIHTLKYNCFDTLVICGKGYPILGKYSDYAKNRKYEIYNEQQHEPFIERRVCYPWEHYLITKPGKLETFFIELSKRVGNPIFVISRITRGIDRTFQYHVRSVDLNDIGITEIMSPEQIYQDLEYFLVNILNESPDVQPKGKPPQTDKEKITAHGFDLKQSFRHRK